MKKVIWIVAIWIILINVFALASVNRLNLTGDTTLNERDPSAYTQTQSWNLKTLHPHWDEHWYLSIARDGYFTNHKTLHSNTAFFPLYPLLIAGVEIFTGNYVIAGVFLSIVFLFLSAIFLWRLVKKFHPENNPVRAVMFLLMFPTAFFLNSIYAESIFLFFSIAFFYFLFKKNFWVAGIFGFLAGLTRITGLFLLIPFAWELYELYKFKLWRRESLPLLLIPLAPVLYFAYLKIAFGNFFQFFDAQAEWGRTFSFNFSHFSFNGTNAVSTSLDIAFVLFGILASIYIIKKIRVSYGLYMLAVILAAVATGTCMSMGRILLVLFPLFILASSLKHEHSRFAWMLPSALLLGLYTILFVNGYWAG